MQATEQGNHTSYMHTAKVKHNDDSKIPPRLQRESLLENRGNQLHKAHLSAFVVLSRDSFASVRPCESRPATQRMATNGDVFRSGGTGHDASGAMTTASSCLQSGGQGLVSTQYYCLALVEMEEAAQRGFEGFFLR
jgi:hypothetical protein